MSGPEEVARWSVVDHDDAWADVDASLRRIHDVSVRDGLASLAYWDAGTWILDVSDPGDPIYVADILAQPVADLQDLANLELYRETVEPPGNAHYAATNPAGDLLAVGRESWNSNAGLNAATPGPDDPGGPSGIALYDVADPSDPTHLSTVDPPPTADPNVNGVWTTAHNFEVGDRYLYSSWYQGGVAVHDVADPTSPERVRYFRQSSTTSFWTAQLAAPGGPVVATSRRNPADLDAPAGVYTLPDVPRETSDSTPSTPTSTPTRPPTPAHTPSVSPTGEGNATQSNTDPPVTPSRSESRTTGAGGPGFGALAALAGIGLGAWRLLGGRGDSGDGP